MDYYIIKFKQSGENKWSPGVFYPFNLPFLPRTIGYMKQCDIDALPILEEVITKLDIK